MSLINRKTKELKVLNFLLTSDGRWRTKNARKNFFKVLERHNLQNQTKSELFADDNKSKYPINPKDIFKPAKIFFKKLYIRESIPKASTTEFLSKIPNRKKR